MSSEIADQLKADSRNPVLPPSPIASVIIATYNRATLIPRAIESVLAQTLQDFELIIIDDGSSDGTADVVARYDDPRIIYQWQEQGERSRARNAGIALSRGRYIAFLDSDDWYLPDKLTDQIATLQGREGGGLALGGWSIVDERGRIIQEMKPWEEASPQPTLRQWLFMALATPITAMVNREWLDRVGGFDVDIPPAEDTEWFIRLSLSDCPVIWTKHNIAVALAHPGNSMKNYQSTKRGRMAFLDKLFSDPRCYDRLEDLTKDEVYASYHLSLSLQAYEARLYDQGSGDLLEAVRLNPSLGDRSGETIRNFMIGHTQARPDTIPEQALGDAFAHLPDSLAYLRSYYRDTLARSYMSRAWRRHQLGDLLEARRSVLRAIGYKPSCLKNRGLQSILVQSVIGSRL